MIPKGHRFGNSLQNLKLVTEGSFNPSHAYTKRIIGRARGIVEYGN